VCGLCVYGEEGRQTIWLAALISTPQTPTYVHTQYTQRRTEGTQETCFASSTPCSMDNLELYWLDYKISSASSVAIN